MRQLVTTLLTRDVERSAAFYRLLAGLSETKRGDAFVILAAADGSSTELCLIDWTSELVPRAARGISEGNYLTLITDDVRAALDVARTFEVEIIEETLPARAVIRDIDGRVVELATEAAYLALPPQKTVA